MRIVAELPWVEFSVLLDAVLSFLHPENFAISLHPGNENR
jgi:hypothetical protein